MHYVKQFNINGVDTRQVACIESKGRPNAATEGCVGALCIDVTSPLHDVYKCVAVNGSIYTWELLSSGLSIVSSSVSGKGADEVQFNYSDLRTPLSYILKFGDLILDSEGYLYQVSSINVTYCTAIYMGVNLVASTHTHPAEDIDRGTIPYERGGTNANSLENAKDNLGIALIEEILKRHFYLGTPGLVYELEGDTYVCKGIGTATNSDIIISPVVEGVEVTSIDDNGFIDTPFPTSVKIPYSVTSIARLTFRGCTSLESIEVDENNQYYRSIDGNLYNKDGTKLIKYAVGKRDTSFEIPDSVTSIETNAFSGNTSLRSIQIPHSLTIIDATSFARCESLASIEIPDSVTSIGTNAFIGCSSLKSIEIPDSVTSIGDGSFSNCTSLESIVIPDSVTSIDSYVFIDCTSLASIEIPDSVTSIGDSAFRGCSFTSITIPDSVTSIGSFAFENCTSLTSITIPNSVTSLGAEAFRGCTNLATINVPKRPDMASGQPWGAPNATVNYYEV